MRACSKPALHNRVLFTLVLDLLFFFVAHKLYAISGLEGTFEFGLDAPWRIEPQKLTNGTVEYGAIPIQITIHDAKRAWLDNILYTTDLANQGGFLRPVDVSLSLSPLLISLGKFHSVRVKELAPVERPAVEYGLKSLWEIEMTTTPWPWPATPGSNARTQQLCRLWKGEDPGPFSDIAGTYEWHAGLWYVPGTKTPGSWVALQIEVILERYPWPVVKLPYTGREYKIDTSRFVTLRNYVRVYLATDPLLRFDNRWLYGDFHYHSQGTDNVGEAGYNYRGVVRAMGAMGLDFVFATDHASSSEQLIDVDLPPVDKIAGIAHDHGDKLRESDATLYGGALRDMDAGRYAFSHGVIYGTNGANGEASLHGWNNRWSQNYLSHSVVPQIFLGGEIDAIPEVKISTIGALPSGDLNNWYPKALPYGDGLNFDLTQLLNPGDGHPYQLFSVFASSSG